MFRKNKIDRVTKCPQFARHLENSKNADEVIKKATAEFNTMKTDKINDIAGAEYGKAETYLKEANIKKGEEENEAAFFAAGKARSYIQLANSIRDLKVMKKKLHAVKKDLGKGGAEE